MTRAGVVLAVLVAAGVGGCHRHPGARARSRETALVTRAISGDAAARKAARRALTGRRDPDLVAQLAAHLTDEDPDHVVHAIRALVALGNVRAVPPLIDLSRVTDPSFTPVVLKAIGELGGREARAYLFTVATGGRTAGVRAAAEAARKDLEARRSARAATRRGG